MLPNGILAILFWAFLVPTFFILGQFVTAQLKFREDNLIMSGIINWALGVGIFAYYLILIGSFGFLKIVPILIFIITTLLFGRKHITECFKWLNNSFFYCFSRKEVTGFGHLSQLCLLGTFVLTGLMCFLPEISNDALAYQLNLPKLFAQSGFIRPIYYDLRSYQSLLMNCLYTTGILFNNVAISKFFHWSCGIFLVLSFIAIAAQEIKNKNIALFYGLMLFLTPTIINQVSVTYVDLGVALFVFLSFYLLKIGMQKNNTIKLFLSGLMIGFAISCKFLALIALIAALVIVALKHISKRNTSLLYRHIALILSGVLIGCGYWLARNWLQSGNPFYPYFGRFFGSEEFEFQSRIYDTLGMSKTAINFFLIPWNITFYPHKFDYHHWIGPFYIVNLPFFIYAGIFIKKLRLAAIYTLTFTFLWFISAQVSRYLLPAFPIFLICSSAGVLEIRNHFHFYRGTLLIKASAFVVCLFLLALTINHFRLQFLPLAGFWSKDTYLKKMERTIPIAEWINRRLPTESVILNRGTVRQFYFNRNMILEGMLNLRTRYRNVQSEEQMVAFLKQRGVTHILSAIDPDKPLIETTTTKDKLLNSIQNNQDLCIPLTQVESENIRESRAVYAVCQLK
jgi:hypothetical protein